MNPLEKFFSPKQIHSLKHCKDQKIAIWSGAVSSGKTFVSLFAFLIAIKNAPRNGEVIIVGRTLDTISGNIFALLQNDAIFYPISATVKYRPGANRAQILGRTVRLYGANDASSETKIRGLTVALAYVDEATIIPEGFWDMLITRLRVPGARLLATTNPGSKNHWLRKKWIQPGDAKGVQHFPFTMRDNPALTDDYKQEMEASYSGMFYRRFILGEWTNAEGAVYPMWDENIHVIPHAELPPIQRTLAIGIDYGTTNPTAAILLGLTDEPQPRLVAIDEWSYSSADHQGRTLTDLEQSREIRAWMNTNHGTPQAYVPPAEYVFLDPAAASMRAQLHQDGITPWAADNAVLEGIATISSLLQQQRLIVTDRCHRLRSEITEYEWDATATENGTDSVIKRDDHALDALRYAIKSTTAQWRPHINPTS